MNNDEIYMKEAIKQSLKSLKDKNIPIGAIIVKNKKIIARGYNRRNTTKNVLDHAEMIAIKEACLKLGDWRLEDCVMYVTVEPCPMCAGAILQSRIKEVVYGCVNKKAGSCGSVVNILNNKKFNHQVNIKKGILKDECSKIVKDFFKNLRAEKNLKKI